MAAKMKLRPDVGPRPIYQPGVFRLAQRLICLLTRGINRVLNRALDLFIGGLPEKNAARRPMDGASAPPLRLVKTGANAVKRNAIVCGILVGLVSFLPSAAVSESSSDSTTIRSKFVGAYISHGSKKDPFMSVSLGSDGTATVVEDPGNGAMTFFGRWVDSGSQVTVTFHAVEGGPAEPPLVLQPIHDGLQAVTWNHARWGNVTPPAMKKGTKVKQLYWFDTVR